METFERRLGHPNCSRETRGNSNGLNFADSSDVRVKSQFRPMVSPFFGKKFPVNFAGILEESMRKPLEYRGLARYARGYWAIN